MSDQAWFEEPELDEKGRPKKPEKVVGWDNQMKAMDAVSKISK